MALFSQRKGLKPISKTMQIESMDAELRNSLWSALQMCYWAKWNERDYAGFYINNASLNTLMQSFWVIHFKQPIDTMPPFEKAVGIVREEFFSRSWNEVYDLIEFTAQTGKEEFNVIFREFCNVLLERENSAYRFVDTELVQITAPEEIKSIEDAVSSKIDGVRIHLAQALSLLSDRKKPDYRNSIKESISAVECVCRLVSGDKSATLGAALKRIGEKEKLHPALEKAFSALYGYTSDEGGIRHSLLEEAKLTFTDAKFMLVTCSAFVNYLLGKAADLKISLKK